MKTNKFTGYCSLYNNNYYDRFIVIPHAFDSSDAKRVPILKDRNLSNPNSVIGYAVLSTANNIGVMAMCFLYEDIEIDNIILDAWVTDVLYAEDFNPEPRQVIFGTIRGILLRQKESCPYHECVTAVKMEESDAK